MTFYSLEGVVQNYDWGGDRFLPELLGLSPEKGTAYAEYWLGVHPKGTSRIGSSSHNILLPALIDQDPERMLGIEVNRQFSGELPFLLKILDVKKMLSIQVHPNREQALAGFQRENSMGIPQNAPNRNYRDPRHKPEVMVAITPFWLLHGFRSAEEAAELLAQHAAFTELSNQLKSTGLESFYREVMNADQSRIDAWLKPLAEEILPAYEAGRLSDKGVPDYWAAKAMVERRPKEGRFDRGIFSIYLLNLVGLQPGQGIFQDAGILHAYLEGVNVELMANSDNVFRGGLSSKHIDIPELLKTLQFDPVVPAILDGVAINEWETNYPAPVADFTLSKIDLKRNDRYANRSQGPEILMLLGGSVRIDDVQVLKPGEAAFIPDGNSYALEGLEEGTQIFKASCPL